MYAKLTETGCANAARTLINNLDCNTIIPEEDHDFVITGGVQAAAIEAWNSIPHRGGNASYILGSVVEFIACTMTGFIDRG